MLTKRECRYIILIVERETEQTQQNKIRNVRLAQLDRAFGYGPKGRGFESSNARFGERLETLKNQWFPAFFVLVNLSSNL